MRRASSASTSSRIARSPASCATPNGKVTGVGTSRGRIGAGKGWHGGGGLLVARRDDGRLAPADRKSCAAGFRLGSDQAALAQRHDLRRRADGQTVFNLLVFATFAESLWHTMLDSAAEYGVVIAHSEELG